jgi:hypothetical protein
VPTFEIPAQLLIEHAGADLQQMVGTRWGPQHLLFLHKPLADNLVDRGFDEAGRNGLAVPVAVFIVRDRRQVSDHVGHDFVISTLMSEHLIAYLCGANLRPFGGFDIKVLKLPPELLDASKVRFTYAMRHGDQWAPCS